jgi:hypothetical protein
MDAIRLNKFEAASRQLDAAIRLLFARDESFAVHTLAGAASRILSDLAELKAPDTSRDKQAQDATGIDAKTYFKVMRETQNFLKHAETDPDGIHVIEHRDTMALMMQAVMNVASLERMLTIPQSVFQLWYLAGMLSELPDLTSRVHATIVEKFKNLSRRTLTYRLSVGRRVLREEIEREPAPPNVDVIWEDISLETRTNV